jgi:hypothetical protein
MMRHFRQEPQPTYPNLTQPTPMSAAEMTHSLQMLWTVVHRQRRYPLKRSASFENLVWPCGTADLSRIAGMIESDDSAQDRIFPVDGDTAAPRDPQARCESVLDIYSLLRCCRKRKRPPIAAALFVGFGRRTQELRIDVDTVHIANENGIVAFGV